MVHPTESRCGLKQGSNYVAITVLTLGSFPGLNTHWVMLQAETRLKLCGNNSFDIGFFSWPEHCIITSRWQAAYICACQSASQKILSDLSDRATGRATNWVMSKDNIGIWLPEQKNILSASGKLTANLPWSHQLAVYSERYLFIPVWRAGAPFTKYLTTVLQLSYDNVKVTTNLRRTSNLQNVLQWMENFSSVRFTCKIVMSSEIVS